MGDSLAFKNGSWVRYETKLGDGTSTGKKAIPAWRNPSGDEIKIPKFNNMMLNLCKYSFFINDRKSCSHYIDQSDLTFGKLEITAQTSAGVKTIGTLPFGDQLAETEDSFTSIPTTQYTINTTKGVVCIKKDPSQSGLGIRLPRALLQNEGDSFTLSMTFAHDDSDSWQNPLQIIGDNSTRNTDGYMRIEVGSNNSMGLYYTPVQGASSTSIPLINRDSNNKIVNVIMRGRREVGTNNLLLDAWFNGSKKTNRNMGVMRGNPPELLCLNTKQTGNTTITNLFIFSLRVWDTDLSDSEIGTLTKIEARNIGLQELNPNGINLWNYLNS